MWSHTFRSPGQPVRLPGPSGAAAVVPLFAVLFALPAIPTPAHAQTSVRLIPKVGLYMPLAAMGEVREDDGSWVRAGRRSASLGWGLALEAGPAREGTSLRAQLVYGTDSRVPVGGFDCHDCSVRSSVLNANLAAVVRPVPRLVLVQPHLVLGAGVKRYGFEPSDARNEGWTGVLRNQTRPSLQLGAGAEASLLGLRTQWELAGFVSPFRMESDSEGSSGNSRLQSDLFLTLSIPIGG
jgi:hypothetical protein